MNYEQLGRISRELFWVEKSQFQKVIYCMTPFIQQFQDDTIIKMENRLGVSRGWGVVLWEVVRWAGCGYQRTAWGILVVMEWKWKALSHVWLFCDPMDCTIHGILQARVLKWVAFPFSRGSSQPRDRTQVSHIAGRFFTSWGIMEAQEYWSG